MKLGNLILDEIDRGLCVEQVNEHIAQCIADIADVNKKATKKRSVVLTIDFHPSESLHHFAEGEREERFTPVVVKADVPQLIFDKFTNREQMMIMLQSRFVDTPERAELLRQIGNLAKEEELLQEDDGVSQRVVTKAGVKRSEEIITNPVMLAPFRTYTEIAQPVSPFVVRLDRSDDDIAVGLFEGDGGAWRNTARVAIKTFLEENLTGEIPVLA